MNTHKQYCLELNLPKCWACNEINIRSGSGNVWNLTCSVSFIIRTLTSNIKNNIIYSLRHPLDSDDPKNHHLYIKAALAEIGQSEYIDFVDKSLILI
jgi:hypothetical protein